MKFWLVSRETLEEAKASRDRLIERLEKEIAELKEERKITIDILGVRAIGQSFYGKVQMPKEEEPEPEPETRPAEDGQQPLIPAMPLAGRARRIAQARGATNLEQYMKDQDELIRLVELAKEEGIRAAEAATPVNGNHS